ncbi:MAG: hypothetical protein Kow00121_17230 [Elainellaceae cyanobacterium]
MLQSLKISKKLLAGTIGIGLLGVVAACAPETPTADAPLTDETETTEVPATEEEPLTGQGPVTEEAPEIAATGNETVAEVVSQAESFSTLQQAIEAAGLEETLGEAGPYTVFAPTDEAFAALPPEVLEQLLQPENQEQLRQVLAYHVVPQGIPSTDITPGEVSTVEGQPVTIADNAGEITVDGAAVVQPDIIASNGVVHAIDQVLVPPGLQLQ